VVKETENANPMQCTLERTNNPKTEGMSSAHRQTSGSKVDEQKGKRIYEISCPGYGSIGGR
jgi:hypothetical protein